MVLTNDGHYVLEHGHDYSNVREGNLVVLECTHVIKRFSEWKIVEGEIVKEHAEAATGK